MSSVLISHNTVVGVYTLAACSVSLVLALCGLVLAKLALDGLKGATMPVVGMLSAERIAALKVEQQERAQRRAQRRSRQVVRPQRTVITAMVAMVAANVRDLQPHAPVLKDDRPVPRLDTAVVRQRVIKRQRTSSPPHVIDAKLRAQYEAHVREQKLELQRQRELRKHKRRELRVEARKRAELREQQRAERREAGQRRLKLRTQQQVQEIFDAQQPKQQQLSTYVGTDNDQSLISLCDQAIEQLRRGGMSTRQAAGSETQQQVEHYELQQCFDGDVLDLMAGPFDHLQDDVSRYDSRVSWGELQDMDTYDEHQQEQLRLYDRRLPNNWDAYSCWISSERSR
jgi:hypothetical protein